MKKLLYISLLFFFVTVYSSAQERTGVWSTAFYNLENLFDTEDDPQNNGDNDFTLTGAYQWTEQKYEKKLGNIARVLSEIGRPLCPLGPALIGVSEVENKRVLEDLCARPELKKMDLKVIHFQSPDRRGIDVGVLYNPHLFTLTSTAVYPFYYENAPANYKTRDILLVTGRLAKEDFAMIVGHWPSRYGGDKSSAFREASARISKHIYDSLQRVNPKMKVVICGDFNDDPTDKSCVEVLKAAPTKAQTLKGGLFNTTYPLYKKGIGTLCYQDGWNLFDQEVISENLLTKNKKELRFWKTEVFNPPYLLTPEGKYKGYPLRTFSGTVFNNGFSDHLPTIVYYIKQL